MSKRNEKKRDATKSPAQSKKKHKQSESEQGKGRRTRSMTRNESTSTTSSSARSQTNTQTTTSISGSMASQPTEVQTTESGGPSQPFRQPFRPTKTEVSIVPVTVTETDTQPITLISGSRALQPIAVQITLPSQTESEDPSQPSHQITDTDETQTEQQRLSIIQNTPGSTLVNQPQENRNASENLLENENHPVRIIGGETLRDLMESEPSFVRSRIPRLVPTYDQLIDILRPLPHLERDEVLMRSNVQNASISGSIALQPMDFQITLPSQTKESGDPSQPFRQQFRPTTTEVSIVPVTVTETDTQTITSISGLALQPIDVQTTESGRPSQPFRQQFRPTTTEVSIVPVTVTETDTQTITSISGLALQPIDVQTTESGRPSQPFRQQFRPTTTEVSIVPVTLAVTNTQTTTSISESIASQPIDVQTTLPSQTAESEGVSTCPLTVLTTDTQTTISTATPSTSQIIVGTIATSHAETALANIPMGVHSITELIELSQGIQGSGQNVTIESEDEEADDIELDIPTEFEELEDEHENDEVQGPALQVVWRFEKLFQNQQELDEFLMAENCWTLNENVYQAQGKKKIYRCRKVKRRGLQCSAGIYTLENFAPDNTTIKLFRKNLDHNCEHSLNKVTQVSDEVRQMIINKYENGDKLQAILYTLRENPDIVQPTKNQVSNIIDTHRRKKHGDPNITLTDLEKFANDWKNIPEDDDAGFVVNFERSELGSNEKWFRLFYSTKRLLRTALLSKVIHADGTYKLNIQGFPVIVVGISDLSKHFHLSGMAICTNEAGGDYKFVFESLRIGIGLISEEEFKPKVLVADASRAITIGFEETFGGETTRVNCFAHLMMNVDKRKYHSPENKLQIKNDIRKIRFAYSESIFKNGSDLFLKKWSTDEPEFTLNFKNVYVENNNLWYAGAVSQAPLTNNCLEGFNRSFKLHQTHYKRQNLSVFKDSMLKFVCQRSKEYVADRPAYQSSIEIKDDLLLDGWEYSASEKSIVTETIRNNVLFHVFAGSNMEKITIQDVKQFQDQIFTDFDDFAKKAFTIYTVTFDQTAQNWKNARCTCPSYSLNYMCKHIVAIAFRLKILKAPEKLLAQTEEPIAAKTPRGRPKKSTPALVRD